MTEPVGDAVARLRDVLPALASGLTSLRPDAVAANQAAAAANPDALARFVAHLRQAAKLLHARS